MAVIETNAQLKNASTAAIRIARCAASIIRWSEAANVTDRRFDFSAQSQFESLCDALNNGRHLIPDTEPLLLRSLDNPLPVNIGGFIGPTAHSTAWKCGEMLWWAIKNCDRDFIIASMEDDDRQREESGQLGYHFNDDLVRQYGRQIQESIRGKFDAENPETIEAMIRIESAQTDGRNENSRGQADRIADNRKKNAIIPFPDTSGFREFYSRVTKAEANGEHLSKCQLDQELTTTHELSIRTLSRTYRRYMQALKASEE